MWIIDKSIYPRRIFDPNLDMELYSKALRHGEVFFITRNGVVFIEFAGYLNSGHTKINGINVEYKVWKIFTDEGGENLITRRRIISDVMVALGGDGYV